MYKLSAVIVLLNTIVVIAPPEQIVCDDGVAMASGLGSTVTVAVIGVPVQPLACGVIVKVTVIGDNVVLVNEPVMSPLPLAAIPVTVPVLFLVHYRLLMEQNRLIQLLIIVPPEQLFVKMVSPLHLVLDRSL